MAVAPYNKLSSLPAHLNAKLGPMDDSDYLRLLTIAAEQANAFLSNARKWERERWVCQRLLQGLNIPYRVDEFAPAGEPPDVLFRDASFEVFFVLDEGRRLNDEWRDELQRRRSAFSLSSLVRREAKPKRIPPTSSCSGSHRPCARKRTTTKSGAWTLGSSISSPSPASSAKCWTSTAIFHPHRILAPGLALVITGGADLRQGAVRPSGCSRLPAQQPGAQHRLRCRHQPVSRLPPSAMLRATFIESAVAFIHSPTSI